MSQTNQALRRRLRAIPAALAALLVLVGLPTVVVGLSATPAFAAGEQAVVGMPFDGPWAWNFPAAAPWDDNVNDSHPKAHPAYGFDWATDVYADTGTAVKVNGYSPQGTVTFQKDSTSDTCSSYGSNIAGWGVTFNVLVNGNQVGQVKYDHLDLGSIGTSPIASGTPIGTVTAESLNSTCYQARHVHVQFKNTAGNYSCYVDNGRPGATTLAYATNLGVLGSANTGAKQACGSVPPRATPLVVTNMFYLNNNFDGTHDILTTYGNPGDPALVGDWDGDGVTTLGVRQNGNVYYLNNTFDTNHDLSVAYGDPNYGVLSGDWDGNGTETLVVRTVNTYYFDNQFDGVADFSVSYGNPGDTVIAGDWDGDGDDTLAVRQNNVFYFDNGFDGVADFSVAFGNAGWPALAGDWGGPTVGGTSDGIGVKYGNTYYLDTNLDGVAEITTNYGDADDHAIAGDWDGDGMDTLGIRRVD